MYQLIVKYDSDFLRRFPRNVEFSNYLASLKGGRVGKSALFSVQQQTESCDPTTNAPVASPSRGDMPMRAVTSGGMCSLID